MSEPKPLTELLSWISETIIAHHGGGVGLSTDGFYEDESFTCKAVRSWKGQILTVQVHCVKWPFLDLKYEQRESDWETIASLIAYPQERLGQPALAYQVQEFFRARFVRALTQADAKEKPPHRIRFPCSAAGE